MKRRSVALALACWPLVAGCGAARSDPETWKARSLEIVESGQDLEAQGAHETRPRLLRDPLLVATVAHYAIEREDAGGEVDRWEVDVVAPTSAAQPPQHYNTTFTGDLDSGVRIVEKLQADQYQGVLSVSKNGGPYEVSPSSMGLGHLRLGFVDACEAAAAYAPNVPQDEQVELLRRTFGALAPTFVLSQVAAENAAVRKLLIETVQLPSWWKLLTLSIDVSPWANVFEAEPVDTAYGPGWLIPFELKINGDPALYAHITAVKPEGALQMTSGLVALDGYAPHDPDVTIRLRFLGASNQGNEAELEPIDARVRTVKFEVTPAAPR